jgi:hypothetical protein
MKVIMLIGEPNSGKTTTIHEVYKSLTGHYHKNWPPKKDFEDIVTHKGKKIGFRSDGDLACSAIEAMAKYGKKGCDILICACRIKFITTLGKAMRDFKKDFIPVFKTMPLCDKSNNADKNTILSHI